MDELRLSQSAVARLAGLKQPSIGRLISGETRRTNHIIELAAALETTPQYLAGEVDDPAKVQSGEVQPITPTQVIQMGVLLPNEAALRDMFRSILVLVPEKASKDEAAAILARRLPSGLASIGPLALDPGLAASPVAGEALPTPARDRPASGPSSHT